ncbi:MAG: sensor histidine kinase [Mesorhizobium sp.]|nr:MAG: sensor histidine kinase [Mesorhizobium sp.]
MSEILRLELQAHGGREGGNFNLDGPAVALPQDAVQAFAMAVHELTTNAVKHGAFASPEGRVDIQS